MNTVYAKQICSLAQLAPMQCRSFAYQAGKQNIEAFLLRLDDRVLAYRNACPHTGAPLNWQPNDFLNYDRSYIQCSIHGAEFLLENGLCVFGPCLHQSLEAVAVSLNNGYIYLAEAGSVSSCSLSE